MRNLLARIGIVVTVSLGLCVPAGASGGRVALVIGNGAYGADGPMPDLPNAPNDATAMATALQDIGFDVIMVTDAGLGDMQQALRTFGSRIGGAEIALFFYAGHGLQVGGENYLLPLAARIERAHDLDYEAITLNQVKRELEFGGPDLSLVILDACRNNPLTRTLAQGATRGLNLGIGLAPAQGARGMLVAYATDPDNVALDGDTENSPFTTALLQHMVEPNLEVRLMFGRVRQTVVEMTNGQQTPWVEEAVIGEYYLNTAAPDPAAAVPEPMPPQLAAVPPEPAPAPAYPDVDPVELAMWETIQEIQAPANKVRGLEHYLSVYPDGRFAALAEIKLLELGDAETAESRALQPDGPMAPGYTLDELRVMEAELPGSDKRRIQEALRRIGHYNGSVDGVFGRGTRTAIRGFQTFENAEPTGYLTPDQQQRLYDLQAEVVRLLDVPDAAPSGRAASAISDTLARYEEGWDLGHDDDPANDSEAVYWLTLAARDRDVPAISTLGTHYARGQGTAQDIAAAMLLWRIAGAAGTAGALFNLGAAFESGWGVDRDFAQARRWYARAADLGHERAEAALTAMAEQGDGQ